MSTLMEMIEHGVDGTKVFVLAGRYTFAERQFLEESALAGYDRMAAFRAEHPNEVASYEGWRHAFYEECLDSTRRTSRTTQYQELTAAPSLSGVLGSARAVVTPAGSATWCGFQLAGEAVA